MVDVEGLVAWAREQIAADGEVACCVDAEESKGKDALHGCLKTGDVGVSSD
jgi:hypothetical protein